MLVSKEDGESIKEEGGGGDGEESNDPKKTNNKKKKNKKKKKEGDASEEKEEGGGVNAVDLDVEEGKVTVTGSIGDPAILIMKLRKAKKIAVLLAVSEKGVEAPDEDEDEDEDEGDEENIPATQPVDMHECSRCE
ncbi:hypothetical protein B296_00035777 [Ensete ventricosum]|uniref:HMA domain-containing protein n=1 Tax=Ensete ventricosum TaxID=4639 RepID=A0A426YK62_ENSVE|nr:hypothetical protein B296_00035777 [Ensete ventricosum]